MEKVEVLDACLLNMSVQCVVKKAKSLLGCVVEDITSRVRQIKLLIPQY